VIAAVVVTTALCADHLAVAAPSRKPQETNGFAARLAVRFTQNLRRAIANDLSCRPVFRGLNDRPADVRSIPQPQTPLAVHPPISPFQFRLPPPLG
jgi:hypothetical protein